MPALPDQRAVVLGQPLQRLERQIEPVEARILALEPRHHPEALGIVVEAAEGRYGLRQRPLARVPERRVAEVVRQRQRLRQVLVEAQHAGDGTGDLRHLQAVGEAGAIVVALVKHEHLRLVGEAPESGGVHDAVAVALEIGAHGAGGLGVDPAGAPVGPGCVGRQRPPRTLFGGQSRISLRCYSCCHAGIPGLTRGAATLCFG